MKRGLGGCRFVSAIMIRWISPLIIAFWLVMTVLLVRTVWFPEQSGLTEVHPNLVLQQFVAQKSVATELHLFDRRKQRIGTVHIATRDHGVEDNGQPRFDLLVTGRIEEPDSTGDTPPTVTWTASSEVVDGEQLSRLRFNLRIPASDVEVIMERSDDEPLMYQMTQRGRVMLSSDGGTGGGGALGPLAGMLSGMGLGLDGLTRDAGSGASGLQDALEVEARQAMIEYGGRARPGYRLTAKLLKRHGAVIEFSMAGELLRVTTDDGYLLVNPIYFGAEVSE